MGGSEVAESDNRHNLGHTHSLTGKTPAKPHAQVTNRAQNVSKKSTNLEHLKISLVKVVRLNLARFYPNNKESTV